MVRGSILSRDVTMRFKKIYNKTEQYKRTKHTGIARTFTKTGIVLGNVLERVKINVPT